MAEPNDYVPAPHFQGHTFKSAYDAFDKDAGRGYQTAKAKNVPASQFVPARISTKSPTPWLLRHDFTGSMTGSPKVFYSKVPYIDHEVRTEYLGEEAELSVAAFCDTGDEYPMQVQDFAGKAGMKKALEKLMFPGGGAGPQEHCEAYALMALYDCRNVDMSNAIIKPPYIIVGDEMPYHTVTREEALELAKVEIEESRLSAKAIFKELMQKYSVYLIQKPYFHETFSGDVITGISKEVYDCWSEILGVERIAFLPDPNRIVDVVFGILAKETGKIDYFRGELEDRQLKDKGGKQKVETVYKSLATIHLLPKPAKGSGASKGHSKTTGLGGGKKTKPLM